MLSPKIYKNIQKIWRALKSERHRMPSIFTRVSPRTPIWKGSGEQEVTVPWPHGQGGDHACPEHRLEKAQGGSNTYELLTVPDSQIPDPILTPTTCCFQRKASHWHNINQYISPKGSSMWQHFKCMKAVTYKHYSEESTKMSCLPSNSNEQLGVTYTKEQSLAQQNKVDSFKNWAVYVTERHFFTH